MSLPLSVLDLSPVASGSTAAEALHNTIDLARSAEGWGYRRHWLAEHHNTPGLASSAPEVMIGQVAAATTRIRVGSGGIMLPNHAPLRVAETFRVLEALFPGRIDLGIGRAPGTDRVTAIALRRSVDALTADDFPQQLLELLAYGGDGFPPDHPFRLGERRAAGRPASADLDPGLERLRRPGRRGAGHRVRLRPPPQPARRRGGDAALPRDLPALRSLPGASRHPHGVGRLRGRRRPRRASCRLDGPRGGADALGAARARCPSPEEAAAHHYTPAELDQVRRYRRAQVLGDPPAVAAELLGLAEQTRADELMVMTSVHDHTERLRSYRLLAEALAPQVGDWPSTSPADPAASKL